MHDRVFERVGIYVLSFISLARRRIEYIACTPNPDGRWAQQARNLVMQLGDQQSFRFLVHDRDSKFSHAFDQVFRSEGAAVIRTPVQAQNAHAERWLRRVRAECLDRILIVGRRPSSMSFAATAAITTSAGHTAHRSYSLPTVATQHRSKGLLAYAAVISSADSSTNTRPPEFANPTRCGLNRR